METTTCLRCGNTDIHLGFIPIYRSQLYFQFYPEMYSTEEPVRIHAILCKSCGHIELIGDPAAFIPTTKRECPHCKAMYAYRKENERYPNVFTCQNCGRKFEVIPPKKCPHCGAVYIYSKDTIIEGSVVCQNCKKEFPYEESQDERDIFDAIEEDLGEE